MLDLQEWLHDLTDLEKKQHKIIQELLADQRLNKNSYSIKNLSLRLFIIFTELDKALEDFYLQPEQQQLLEKYLHKNYKRNLKIENYYPLNNYQLLKGIFFYYKFCEAQRLDQSSSSPRAIQYLTKSAFYKSFYAHRMLCTLIYPCIKLGNLAAVQDLEAVLREAAYYHWTPGLLLNAIAYLKLGFLMQDRLYNIKSIAYISAAQYFEHHSESQKATNIICFDESLTEYFLSNINFLRNCNSWESIRAKLVTEFSISAVEIELASKEAHHIIKALEENIANFPLTMKPF